MSNVVVAAGLIIFRRISTEIQFLLLHASYEENLWSPPKGHVDPGETEFEAALRETREEAGYNESHLKIVENYCKELNYQVIGKPKRVVYWAAELLDPSVEVTLSDEHRDFAWFGLSKAKETVRFEDMQQTLQDTDSFLKEYLKSEN